MRTVTDPKLIRPLQTRSGQTVEDIILGFDAPGDIQYVIRFYLESDPNRDQLRVPLNQRATFRWVPRIGLEIKVLDEDRLLWEVVSSVRRDPDGTTADVPANELARLCVWTKGIDRHTKRCVINQSEYESDD